MAYNAGASDGNLVLLSSQQASGASILEFKSVITSKYNDYVLRCSGVTGSGVANLLSQYSTDNGSTYLAGGNYNGAGFQSSHDSGAFFAQNGQDQIIIIQDMSGVCQYAYCNYFGINLNLQPFVTISCGTSAVANYWQYQYVYSSSIIVNAFKIYPNAGTISGSFNLYGVQK